MESDVEPGRPCGRMGQSRPQAPRAELRTGRGRRGVREIRRPTAAGPLRKQVLKELAPQLANQLTVSAPVSAPATVDQGLNVPLIWWSGAGSNRRPSAFQAHPPGRCAWPTGAR